MDEKINQILKKIHIPAKDSHKGKNGKLLIIGGSKLFHAASLWSLQVASRIVDLVHYASIPENNRIVAKLKEEFRNGIVISRIHIEDYINEDDCILIGPGMVRSEAAQIPNPKSQIPNLEDIEQIDDEGVQTYYLTRYLLQKYPQKRWVIDAGALQMMELEWIPENAILTPHHGEFEIIKSKINPSTSSGQKSKIQIKNQKVEEQVSWFAEEYNCTVLLKGKEDIIASDSQIEMIKGGNAGMTKGGTGDVLAGLVAALYCKMDAFTSSVAGSYINKKAGDNLFQRKGYWFNASDLADEVPVVMKKLLLG